MMNVKEILDLLQADRELDLDFRIEIFDEIDSTNEYLARAIEAKTATVGSIVIAKTQTAGRGQRGRKWESDLGGLYLSLCISPDLLATNIHQLTIGIAWGIAHQLRLCGIPIALKWPNDLMLGQRKLGGILTETRISGNRVQHAIVGVGINHTNSVGGNAANLASANNFQLNYRSFSIEMLTHSTIKGIISGYKRCTPAAIDSLLSDYLDLLNARGRSVIVNGKLGTVLGVSPQGELHVGFSTTNEIDEIYLQPGTFTLGYLS
jgi:BirA family transcriptional regulator, biotin operon repressor / biotin---[acetyl-CoA-carboxylase] ligase